MDWESVVVSFMVVVAAMFGVFALCAVFTQRPKQLTPEGKMLIESMKNTEKWYHTSNDLDEIRHTNANIKIKYRPFWGYGVNAEFEIRNGMNPFTMILSRYDRACVKKQFLETRRAMEIRELNKLGA